MTSAVSRIPFAAKVAYTLWMAIWVPLYWEQNGAANFLWLCDFANFVILVAIWWESAVLVSSQLAGVLFIQVLWTLDFLGRLLAGVHPIGGTEYMFDAGKPLWLRGLSLFHVWSVPLLVWLVCRLGYDERGWKLQGAFACLLLPAGLLFGTKEQNLNWVWSPFGIEQTWVPPALFVPIAILVSTLVLFWGGHLVSRRWLVRSAQS